MTGITGPACRQIRQLRGIFMVGAIEESRPGRDRSR